MLQNLGVEATAAKEEVAPETFVRSAIDGWVWMGAARGHRRPTSIEFWPGWIWLPGWTARSESTCPGGGNIPVQGP